MMGFIYYFIEFLFLQCMLDVVYCVEVYIFGIILWIFQLFEFVRERGVVSRDNLCYIYNILCTVLYLLCIVYCLFYYLSSLV